MIETEHPREVIREQNMHSDSKGIVLQISSVVVEKAKDDEEADETTAAKKTILEEDVEIRRLIEESKNTPKEEKQRLKKSESNFFLKVLSKKKQKLNKTARHSNDHTRRLQRCKEHPKNQICKEKSAHHQDKELRKGEVITSRLGKELPMSSVNSTNKCTTTADKKTLW